MQSRLRSRWMLLGVFVVIVVAALALIFAERSSSPTPIKAESVIGTPDSTHLSVVFPWHHDGLCVGQFSVRVEESATQVSVQNVLNHGTPSRQCGGIGTDGQHAAVDVTLRSNLGTRTVVRVPDGTTLPVRAPTADQ